jgi:hypothetical protein
MQIYIIYHMHADCSQEKAITTQTFTSLIKTVYHTPALAGLVPAAAVSIDYALTFSLASGTSMILRWEASPFVRFAVANNAMLLYLTAIILFYYLAAYGVLHVLESTPYYRFGFALILLVSITHVLGGLSWQFRTAWYSNAIVVLSFTSILIAIILFGYTLITHRNAPT